MVRVKFLRTLTSLLGVILVIGILSRLNFVLKLRVSVSILFSKFLFLRLTVLLSRRIFPRFILLKRRGIFLFRRKVIPRLRSFILLSISVQLMIIQSSSLFRRLILRALLVIRGLRWVLNWVRGLKLLLKLIILKNGIPRKLLLIILKILVKLRSRRLSE